MDEIMMSEPIRVSGIQAYVLIVVWIVIGLIVLINAIKADDVVQVFMAVVWFVGPVFSVTGKSLWTAESMDPSVLFGIAATPFVIQFFRDRRR